MIVPLPAMNRESVESLTYSQPRSETIERMAAGIGVVDGVAEDYLCAKGLYGLDLRGVGIFRQNDDGLRAEYATRIGHALSEVAGGGYDYAALFLLGAELGHRVEGAANLERAEAGVIFVLDVGLGAEEGVEAGVVVEWGGGHIVG